MVIIVIDCFVFVEQMEDAPRMKMTKRQLKRKSASTELLFEYQV